MKLWKWLIQLVIANKLCIDIIVSNKEKRQEVLDYLYENNVTINKLANETLISYNTSYLRNSFTLNRVSLANRGKVICCLFENTDRKQSVVLKGIQEIEAFFNGNGPVDGLAFFFYEMV